MNPLHNPGQPITVPLGTEGQRLVGFSISALATYVLCAHWDLMFDLGYCPLEAVKIPRLFLTHGHLDHMAGVPVWAALRQMQGLPAPTLYCPVEAVEELRSVLSAHDRLERNAAGARMDGWVRIEGVRHGDRVELGRGRSVDVFAADHVLPSVGYTVTETRRALKAEYRGKPAAELARLTRAGTAINDERSAPLLTFIGDSSVEPLRRNPELGRSETLVIEVTHLDDVDPEFSRKHGHTHIDDLRALWEDCPEALASPRIILKHFSMRYQAKQIRAMQEELPAGLKERVTVLIPE